MSVKKSNTGTCGATSQRNAQAVLFAPPKFLSPVALGLSQTSWQTQLPMVLSRACSASRTADQSPIHFSMWSPLPSSKSRVMPDRFSRSAVACTSAANASFRTNAASTEAPCELIDTCTVLPASL